MVDAVLSIHVCTFRCGQASEILPFLAADMNSTIGVIPVDYTGSFITRVVTSDDIRWSLKIQELVMKKSSL